MKQVDWTTLIARGPSLPIYEPSSRTTPGQVLDMDIENGSLTSVSILSEYSDRHSGNQVDRSRETDVTWVCVRSRRRSRISADEILQAFAENLAETGYSASPEPVNDVLEVEIDGAVSDHSWILRAGLWTLNVDISNKISANTTVDLVCSHRESHIRLMRADWNVLVRDPRNAARIRRWQAMWQRHGGDMAAP